MSNKFECRTFIIGLGFVITSTIFPMCSAFATSDTPTDSADTSSTPISINANPDAAQQVPVDGYNPQAAQLQNQENMQNQQQALSKNQTFVPNAPDAHDSTYWADKNRVDNNADSGAGINSSSEPVDQTRLNNEQQGFKSLLSQWNNQKPKFISVPFDDKSDKNGNNGGSNSGKTENPVIALAGTRWYATMAGGADSYVPGPVRVQLQEGPFAGGYALGKFQIAPDGDHLILTFTTLSYGGHSYSVSAVAVDPHSQISGVTGDIDHHFFVRYVMPGAIGFLQGAVNLLKANQTVVMNGTTSTVAGPQLSDMQLALLMASSAADRLQEATSPQGVLKLPEVKIAPGSGLGFLLLKSVS
jgi:hypothetical protein